jgi:DNA-binding GntR family transcriptional regulator
MTHIDDRPPRSAVETVVRSVRNGPLSGRFVPGQRLVEADLVSEFGVARNSLREALATLAAQGIVELRPNRGASIRLLTREDVIDRYQIREVVEGLAARLAAERIMEGESADDLHDAYRAMQKARRSGDINGYVGENLRFHTEIVKLSGNGLLGELTDHLRLQTFHLQFGWLVSAENTGRSMRGHDAILKAIIAGDGALAERRMRRHVSESCSVILDFPGYVFSGRQLQRDRGE